MAVQSPTQASNPQERGLPSPRTPEIDARPALRRHAGQPALSPLIPTDLDTGFIGRVLRTTGAVALLLGLMVYGWLGWRFSLGLLGGAALGMGSLWSISWTVQRLVRPGPSPVACPKGRRSPLGAVALLKLPLLAAAAWLVVQATQGSVAAMGAAVAGATLVPVVIILKLAGRWLIAQPPPGERRPNSG